MTDKEYREKVRALLKLMTTKNISQQEFDTARNKLMDLIKENNFPNLLFHTERSKEEGRFTTIYTGLCTRIATEMRNEEKRARLKLQKSKSDSIMPIQCRESKGFEQLKQTRIITDRDFNLLYNDPKQGTKIEGDFSYRTKWIHDVFVNELVKWNKLRMFPFEIDASAFEKSIQEDTVKIIAQNFSNLREELPVVNFTDKDFRNVTGLKHLSNEEIKSLVEKYQDLRVTGTIVRYYDELKGATHRVRLFKAPYVSIIYKETEYKSPRGQKPENEYTFLIDFGGFMVLQNLINQWFTFLPKKFYKLPGGAQEIERKLAQFSKTQRRSITTISAWLGYVENPKDIYSRRKLIERHLDALKKDKFLRFWKATGRGRKTVYTMVRM